MPWYGMIPIRVVSVDDTVTVCSASLSNEGRFVFWNILCPLQFVMLLRRFVPLHV
jgi:hypothetical protein